MLKIFSFLLVLLFASFCEEVKWPVGEKIVDFEAQAVGGQMVDTFKIRSGKALVLKMGNLRCPHCSHQLEVMGGIDTEYEKQGVLFLDVTTDDDDVALLKHAKKYGVDFLTLKDPGGSLGTYYGVDMIPVTIIADKNGVIRWYNQGFVDRNDLVHQIKDVLKIPLNSDQK